MFRKKFASSARAGSIQISREIRPFDRRIQNWHWIIKSDNNDEVNYIELDSLFIFPFDYFLLGMLIFSLGYKFLLCVGIIITTLTGFVSFLHLQRLIETQMEYHNFSRGRESKIFSFLRFNRMKRKTDAGSEKSGNAFAKGTDSCSKEAYEQKIIPRYQTYYLMIHFFRNKNTR